MSKIVSTRFMILSLSPNPTVGRRWIFQFQPAAEAPTFSNPTVGRRWIFQFQPIAEAPTFSNPTVGRRWVFQFQPIAEAPTFSNPTFGRRWIFQFQPTAEAPTFSNQQNVRPSPRSLGLRAQTPLARILQYWNFFIRTG